jgi:UDP-N-acetylmuramyl tripeptide synthase
LIAVKAIVARSITTGGTLVVNADDQGLINYFQNNPDLIRGKICWFSLDPDNEKIRKMKGLNQPCIWLEDGNIIIADEGKQTNLISVTDIPTTINGAARHNISNSMGAAGHCYAMKIGFDDIAAGLSHFQGDNKDNPGRGNYFDINGVTILVDFAHNSHSLSSVVETVEAMSANRHLIMLGHAGDRTDRDIFNLTDVAFGLKPDVIVTAEIPDYLRGRELGAVPALIHQHCLEKGLEESQIWYAESCLSGAKLAIKWAKPGDFVLLLALDQRDEVFRYLESLS